MRMHDIGVPCADMPVQQEKGFRQLEGLASVTYNDRFDVIISKKIIEIASSAGNRNSMPQLTLGACKIDGRMDMPVQSLGVIEEMKNSHGKYLTSSINT